MIEILISSQKIIFVLEFLMLGSLMIICVFLWNERTRLLAETITDSLTGLYNYRHFQASIKNEIIRSTRYHHSFCFLIADIDHFKIYNDTHGHQMGNTVLKQVSGILKKSLRRETLIARYGGDEFAIIFPETNEKGGVIAANHLRQIIEKFIFPGEENQPKDKLTISIGGAAFPQDGRTAEELIEKADHALYLAKNSGRNSVMWEGFKKSLNENAV